MRLDARPQRIRNACGSDGADVVDPPSGVLPAIRDLDAVPTAARPTASSRCFAFLESPRMASRILFVRGNLQRRGR